MGLTTNLNCCRILFHEQYHLDDWKFNTWFFGDSTLWSEKTACVLFCLKKATFQEGQVSQESLKNRHPFFWAVDILGKVMARWTLDFHDCQIEMPWGFKDGVSEIDEEAFSATVGEFFPRGPDTEGFTPQYVVAGVAWSNWLQDFWGWKVKTKHRSNV